MTSVFLILVHANSSQLKRLIQKLMSDNSFVYLQVDLKADIQLFKEYQQYKNVVFIKNRIRITWGGYSQVQGMLNSFAEIVPHFSNEQYVSVISGQDYPLMSIEKMNAFLQENQGKAFMEYYPVYETWKEAIPRFEKFHFTDYQFPGKFNVESLINALMPKRVPPKELIYVGRSSWFTLTVEHLKYILKFLASHAGIRKFFKLTWGCDEFVFQTILYSSQYQSQIVNDNLRYIDWSLGGARPKILTMEDADKLKESKKFFARKFDQNIDSNILDWIDEQLLN